MELLPVGLLAVGGASWVAVTAWHAIESEAEATVYAVQKGAIEAQAARFGAHLALLEATAGQVASHPNDLAAGLWASPTGWDETTGELRIVIFSEEGTVRFDSAPEASPIPVPQSPGLAWTGAGDAPVISATAWMTGGGWVVLQEPVEGFAPLLSSPWSWVVSPEGRILAHADVEQVGTTPFEGRALDRGLERMLESMRSGHSGTSAYTWTHADGSREDRMAAFAPIPGSVQGWAIGTSVSRDDALMGVSRARTRLGLAGLSLVMLAGLAGLAVVQVRRDQRRRERLLRQERLAMTAAAAHGERLAMLGTLTAGVAHDLRGPLSAVRGLSELLVESEADSDEVEELAEDLDQALRTLSEMVDDLTSFARTRADGGCEPMEALQLTERMVNASLRHKVALSIASSTQEAVTLDRRRLSQSLVNLAMNAHQAGASRVHIHAQAVPEGVAICVDDDGPGVPAEVRGELFQPFFTTKPDGEGTGLGLHLVQRFVQEAGGSVATGDSPLGGARFRLLLPVVRAESAAEGSVTGGPQTSPRTAVRRLGGRGARRRGGAGLG